MSKAETKLDCDLQRPMHFIDRRDFIKDTQGNYILDPRTGEKQLNMKCACGKASANSAEFRGLDFSFVYGESTGPKPPHQAK